jgi:quaternary ammonium compound-resistance protein SugE
MELALLTLAAFCFASGGVFMKTSAGASRPLPTMAFLLLFVAGAVLQARAMRRLDMGVAYVAVLGLEAVLALGFSILLLGERLSLFRLFAVILIVSGVALLRRY